MFNHYDTVKDMYERLRKEGQGDLSHPSLYPAKVCLQIAKGSEKARAHPLQDDGDEYETDDGFKVRLSVDYDDFHDTLADALGDGYGEITQRVYDSGYAAHDGHNGYDLTREYNRDIADVYEPSTCHTFADRVAQCRKVGMARNAAHLAALDGLRREAEQYQHWHKEGYQAYSIVVTVERDGEEWAQDSIGGSYLGDGYTAAHVLLDYTCDKDALEEARERLTKEREAFARALEEERPDMYATC